jgi:hypothetical protein
MEASGPVLLAIDAPLGWPAPLAQALHAHAAGDSLAPDAHSLFRRSTDVFVKQHVGQQPLDVGADRIARTAYEALSLLRDLRMALSQPLPLAWAPDHSESSVIEVYPAATLRVHGFTPQGYKGKNGEAVRRAYLERLTEIVSIDAERRVLIDNANAFDALVCLIAAQDFLRGVCYAPVDPSIAHREGWIWVSKSAHRVGGLTCGSIT